MLLLRALLVAVTAGPRAQYPRQEYPYRPEYDDLVAHPVESVPARDLDDYLLPGNLSAALKTTRTAPGAVAETKAHVEALLNAVQLKPSGGAEYAALAAWAKENHDTSASTVAALYRQAVALSPSLGLKERNDLRFKLSNAYADELRDMHKGRAGMSATDATLKEVRRCWATELRALTRLDTGRFNVAVWSGLGQVLQLQGKDGEAEEAFRRAAQLISFDPINRLVRRIHKGGLRPASFVSSEDSLYHSPPWDTERAVRELGKMSAKAREDAREVMLGIHDVLLQKKGRRTAAQAAAMAEVKELGSTLGFWRTGDQRPKQYTTGLLACPWHRKEEYAPMVRLIEEAAGAMRDEMMELLRRRVAADRTELVEWCDTAAWPRAERAGARARTRARSVATRRGFLALLHRRLPVIAGTSTTSGSSGSHRVGCAATSTATSTPPTDRSPSRRARARPSKERWSGTTRRRRRRRARRLCTLRTRSTSKPSTRSFGRGRTCGRTRARPTTGWSSRWGCSGPATRRCA